MNGNFDSHPSGKIDISVIIVNWNTKDLLRNCLKSLYQTVKDLVLEVIVVDNGSSDGSVAMLEKEFPDVIRIVNKENRGFGAANNQAFAIMKGDHALLLNSDTILTPDAVSKLFDFMKSNEKAAIVCGQLLNEDGTKQNSVASFPSLLNLAINNSLLEILFPGIYPSKRYEHKLPIRVDSAIGACVMIRKKALDETGFFDERYFFFFEETDMALAMKFKGWETFHVPDAFIYHLQGQSVGHSIRSRIEFYRSRYQFLRKWHDLPYFYLSKFIILMRLFMDAVLNLIFTALTLGLNKKAINKFVVYSQLIAWHFQKSV